MQQAVYSYAADQCSTAYPCADRQIRERMQALRGAERALPDGGSVRIRIESDGYVERSSEAARKIGVAPSLFGRGGDIPPGRGAGTGIYGTERPNAQCGQCTVSRPGPEEVDSPPDRFGGRSSGKFDALKQRERSVADGAYELCASGLDAAVACRHVLCRSVHRAIHGIYRRDRSCIVQQKSLLHDAQLQ